MTSDLRSTFQYSGFSKALFKFDSRLYFNYEVFKCVFIYFALCMSDMFRKGRYFLPRNGACALQGW